MAPFFSDIEIYFLLWAGHHTDTPVATLGGLLIVQLCGGWLARMDSSSRLKQP